MVDSHHMKGVAEAFYDLAVASMGGDAYGRRTELASILGEPKQRVTSILNGHLALSEQRLFRWVAAWNDLAETDGRERMSVTYEGQDVVLSYAPE